MSAEDELAHCMFGTAAAAAACAAFETGVGAIACVAAVGDAAYSCYEAGRDLMERYESEHGTALPEPDKERELSPDDFIDDSANQSSSWTAFNTAGVTHLDKYNEQRINNERPIAVDIIPARASALTFTQSRDAIIQLATDWNDFATAIQSLRFQSHDAAEAVAIAYNNANSFAGLRRSLRAII